MMKFILVIVACLIAATMAAPLSEEQYQFLFTKFTQQYNKQYETNDFFGRYATFKSNLDVIIAHNAQNLSYKMGVNEFADLSATEFSRMMGIKAVSNAPVVPESQPCPYLKNGTIDWTKKIKINVKNQASCGSCWAFSTTASLEAAITIQTGNTYDLSEQQLVDCDNGSSGCNGGLMSSGYNYIVKAGGVCLTSDYEYTARDGSCKDSCKKVAETTKVSGYKSVKGDAGLQQEIQNGPVSVALAASSSAFQFYKSGVVENCTDRGINHGVTLVGLDVLNGTEFYYIKNSWGASWGDNGYIRLSTKGNQCALGTSNFDVVPKF